MQGNQKHSTTSAEKYSRLTSGGQYQITLNQAEACIVLKSYDHGIESLTKLESDHLQSIISKLKDEIYP